MKRQKLIETIVSFLSPNDIIVFCGEALCKSAYAINKDNFYYTKGTYGLGVALGISMCTDKRVFVFCRDAELVSDLSIMAQMSAGHSSNLFCIVLNEGYYQEIANQPTITKGLYSIKGLLFNYGFITHDYTHFFKGHINKKLLTATIERIKGPMVIVIDVSPGLVKAEEKVPKNLDSRITSLILDKNKETSLYGGSY